jgi:DNA-binding NarL/FixJ family response regulator
MSINIILADDHRILRESLRRVLEIEPGMTVVAEAQDGNEAIEYTSEYHPDILIMDISMPNRNGIDAACEIHQSHPSTKILILSMHSNKQFVEDAFNSGIDGYLLKNCAYSEIVVAIKTVLEGKFYISPDIAGVVLHEFVQQKNSNDQSSENELSKRELEILELVSNGETTKQIADNLCISEKKLSKFIERTLCKNCNVEVSLN